MVGIFFTTVAVTNSELKFRLNHINKKTTFLMGF